MTIVNPLSSGKTLQVGPDKQYKVPSAAIKAAQVGDTIEIDAGEYRGDVVAWYTAGLHIKGVGGMVSLRAAGQGAQGKAIFVAGGPNSIVENIEFRDCKVSAKNGAGIRMEQVSGYLYLKGCKFFDNENGVMSANNLGASLIVEDCEFGRNTDGGTGGQAHNLYLGYSEKLIVRRSFFYEARYGSNIKSRAKESLVEHCYVMDGGGQSSYAMDFSNGGKITLRGNLIHKGSNSPNDCSVACGTEGQKWVDNSLVMTNNTLVSHRALSNFVRIQPWFDAATLTANVFASTRGTTDGLIYPGGFPEANVKQDKNLRTTNAAFFGADNIAEPNFWPNAEGQKLISITALPDPTYTTDAPAPFVLRKAATTSPRIGALQSSPREAGEIVTPPQADLGPVTPPVVVPPVVTPPVVTPPVVTPPVVTPPVVTPPVPVEPPKPVEPAQPALTGTNAVIADAANALLKGIMGVTALQGVSLGSASATYDLTLPGGEKKAITVSLSVQDAP